MPPRFRIRQAASDDAAAIARVQAVSWQATYRGIVPQEYLDSIDVGEWTERRFRELENSRAGACSHVAEVENEIVGWAYSGPNRDQDSIYAGELYAIYLLPEHQRRGIGLALTVAAAKNLIESGMSSMLLWVLAGNWPARRFYEALGGEYISEQQITIGNVPLPEVAYGWKDLGPLIDLWS